MWHALGFGVSSGLCHLSFLVANLRMVINMGLMQVMMLEGIYLWGGAGLAATAASCLIAIFLISFNVSADDGAPYILMLTLVLSIVTLLPNFNFFNYMHGRVTEKANDGRLIQDPSEELMLLVYQLFVTGQAFVFFIPVVAKPMSTLNRWKHFLGAFLLLPLMNCVVPVFLAYAFSNVHDVTWGNRPNHTENTSKQARELAQK